MALPRLRLRLRLRLSLHHHHLHHQPSHVKIIPVILFQGDLFPASHLIYTNSVTPPVINNVPNVSIPTYIWMGIRLTKLPISVYCVIHVGLQRITCITIRNF